MSYTDKLVDELNEVLKRSYDAILGYKSAIDDVEDRSLKAFFAEQVDERVKFARELTSEIVSLGGEPVTESSFKGTLHRAWMDLKSAVASNNDEKTLQECIRGERAARKDYEDILKGELSLTPSVSNMLTRHQLFIDKSIITLEMMEIAAE